MTAIDLEDATARLGELVDLVGAGETFDITRRGKRVARLTAVAVPRKRVDLAALRALTAAVPPQGEGAADLVRAMRDDRF